MIAFAAAYDWGLGHTTRLIPIIERIIGPNDTLIIGATIRQRPIFEEHFPNAVYVHLPDSSPVFGIGVNQNLRYLIYFPLFIIHLIRDKILARRLVKKMEVTTIISDNRYGLRNSKVHNILITHQLSLKLPGFYRSFSSPVQRMLNHFINAFDECFIPDFEEEVNLAGNLSKPNKNIHIPLRYIGPQSRLKEVTSIPQSMKADLLILLSGPEKQRTVFEKIIETQLENCSVLPSYLVIRGLPEGTKHTNPNFINHANSQTLKSLIENAKYIICRSGYSTIMDLTLLGKTACIVPTPGQSEQEYLAEYHNEKGTFISISQETFQLKHALSMLSDFKPKFPF